MVTEIRPTSTCHLLSSFVLVESTRRRRAQRRGEAGVRLPVVTRIQWDEGGVFDLLLLGLGAVLQLFEDLIGILFHLILNIHLATLLVGLFT